MDKFKIALGGAHHLVHKGLCLVLALGRDPTDPIDPQQADERINRMQEENKVLMQEVHHRVKNNLQFFSSLLKLQAGRIQDPKDLALFRDIQYRIHSMAIVHEQVYASQDLTRIDFEDCVLSLLPHLFRSYHIDGRRVQLHVEVKGVRLGVNTAISCGLIVNELVANALRHAFPEGRSGEIQVKLSNAGKRSNRLIVSDDGVGLPPETDLNGSTAVGLDLVKSLVGQLGGRLQVERSKGSTFRITFPMEKA